MGTGATSAQTGVKGIIAMFGPSDLVGLLGAIVGAIGTICSIVKNPVIQVICITISQVLLLFSWFFFFCQTCNNIFALFFIFCYIVYLNNDF